MYEFLASAAYTWIVSKQHAAGFENWAQRQTITQTPDGLVEGVPVGRADLNSIVKALNTELALEPQPTEGTMSGLAAWT